MLGSGGLTGDDFAEAVSILASEYNFINNGFIIDMLFDEANNPDSVINRADQRSILDQLSAGDVAAFLNEVASQSDRVDVRNAPAG